MGRIQELIKLEKKVRSAILGSDWETRVELRRLHTQIVREIEGGRRTN